VECGDLGNERGTPAAESLAVRTSQHGPISSLDYPSGGHSLLMESTQTRTSHQVVP
jgi:hypothetical protein